MLTFWEAKARRCPPVQGAGFIGNIGDISWAHRSERAAAGLIGYESELNCIMSNNPCYLEPDEFLASQQSRHLRSTGRGPASARRTAPPR